MGVSRTTGRAFMLACILASSLTRAEALSFVVQGTLTGTASTANRTCVLYAAKSPNHGSRMAEAKTSRDGTFTLTTDRASQGTGDLWVVCPSPPPVDIDIVCTPRPVAASSPAQGPFTVEVRLACHPRKGASPKRTAEALAALAETHEVLAWAGVEALGTADAVLEDAVAKADTTLTPADRAQLKTALAAAGAPLRSAGHRGLPLLPSLARDDFADEMIAAAPGWRWLTDVERDDHAVAPYGERDDRFEGEVIHRVGSTPGDALVSLSEGPLALDPETQATATLTWTAAIGARTCLEAVPTIPELGWKMRKAMAPGGSSFTWDLAIARRAGVKKGTIGVVARSCTDADRDEGPYLPIRTGTAASAYRLVFLFPRQLESFSLAVYQGDGASHRPIALPDGAIQFDPHAVPAKVIVDVPMAKLVPGLVHLEMSGRGAGKFGPAQLSFVHAQQGG